MEPKSIDAIFWDAAQIASADEQNAYLDRACADNAVLRRRVEQLLAARPKAASFLESPTPSLVATVDEPMVSERPGTVIGPYKLLEQIGEGGFGLVFVAEQQQPLRRMVAVKVIKPGMDTREVIARFEAERQALALMDHPNIAHVLDGGATASGRPYFVMELVKGVPITDFCDQNHLAVRQRLELFINVCQAVQHAHQKGIIHRDLKPSNIMVMLHDASPVVKVIDFGVAKAIGQQLTEKTLYSRLTQMIGTPVYMSPEQAGMSGLDIDTRTDIYSLGVLLYELLTGTTPIDKRRLSQAGYDEIRRLIREEEPPKPSTRISMLGDTLSSVSAQRQVEPAKLGRLLKGELDWMVMKALEKDRTRRYATANGFAADIVRYLNDEPIEAGPPSPAYRMRKFARRNRGVLATAAFVAATLVLGTVISIWQAIRATEAGRLAQTRLEAETRARLEEQKQRSIAQEERDRARNAEKRAAEAARKATAEAAISQAVNDFINRDLLGPDDPQPTPDRNLKLRHVLDRAALKLEGKFQQQPLIEAGIRMTLGHSYLGLSEFPAAERHFKRARELYGRTVGREHSETLRAQYGLAMVLNAAGQFEKARTLHEEIAKLRRRMLGAEHRDTLDSMFHVANSLRAQMRLEEARKINDETFHACKRVLGPEHPQTLTAMCELAVTLHAQVLLQDARKLHDETLRLRKSVIGPEHPDTLGSMHQLARALHDLASFHEERKLLEEMLAIRRRVLGLDHPDTLVTMHYLADCLYAVGQKDEGRKIMEQTLELRQRLLGPEHPHTFCSKNALVNMFLGQRQQDEARKLCEEVLQTRRRVLGTEHADTLVSMSQLAHVFLALGRLDEARKLFEETLQLRRRVLGPEHPHTLASMRDLALVLLRYGLLDQNRKLWEDMLQIQGRVRGAENPETLSAMSALASVLEWQDRLEEGRKLREETLQLRRRVLGPWHPDTLRSMNNLAWSLATATDPKFRDPARAVELQKQVTEHAPEDPNNWNTLAMAYYSAKDWKNAITAVEKSMEIQKADDGYNWMLLAMAQWQLGRKEEARQLYGRAIPWMDKYCPKEPQACRLRAEAEQLLQIRKK